MGGTQRSNVRNARVDQLSQIFSVTFQRKHKKQRLPRKISERKLKRRLIKGNSSGEKGKLETTRTEGLFKYGYPAYLPLSFELYHKG